MYDLLEKVLDGIEEVRNSGIQCPLENVEPRRCLFFPEKLIDDIVFLLKAQEPKKVKHIIGTAVSAMGECPSCGAELNTSFLEGQRKTKFCYNCGQAVKWDG